MAPKIFNRALAFVAGIIISTAALAQDTTSVALGQADTSQVYVFKDNKELGESMSNLKGSLRKLTRHVIALSTRHGKTIAVSATALGKDFESAFKDFGKDIAASFDAQAAGIGEDDNQPGSNSDDDDGGFDKKITGGEITEKIKNYTKSYSVDGNDLLQIDNRFGKVTVNTWAKNEFKVDVQMKFSSDNADYVNSMINGASVSDSKVGSLVSFKTNLSGNNNRNGGRHQSMEINYTVYMPAGNPVDIENKFGSVILPDLSGKALIRVSYGSLTSGALTNGQNDVTVKFGEANIANFNGGKIEVAYGGLKTGTVNNINADIKFSSISIDRLKGSADVTVKYGDGFRIGTIDKTVKNINVDAQFTKINFDFKQLENFTFDVTTRFGSFNYDDDRVKVTSKSPSDEERGWSSTKSYKGYVGSSGSGNRIVINASYTGVSFN